MSSQPNPTRIMEALNAYQITLALKGAVELEIFTHIADGASTAAEIATRCSAAERGVRILCDFLTVSGFLTKTGATYRVTPDSGATCVGLLKKIRASMNPGGTLAITEIMPNEDRVSPRVAGLGVGGGVIRRAGRQVGESATAKNAVRTFPEPVFADRQHFCGRVVPELPDSAHLLAR